MKLESVYIPACVRDARLRGDVFDMTVAEGLVHTITPATNLTAQGTVLPGLVDIHLHLDKSYTVRETGPANGDLFKAIDLISHHRATWTAADLRRRMEQALQEAWQNGTRAARTHLDWGAAQRPPSIDVLLQLRSAWAERIALQWVSLTALDLFDDATIGQTIATQVQAGGGILGCFVYRNDNLRARLQGVFDLAQAHDLDLDFHVDEGLDADAIGLGEIARLTLERGWQGRVTCGHACSLAIQSPDYALQILEQLGHAGIGLVALPTTNLYLQGAWNSTPVPRGITRVAEARHSGVKVCISTDNVADPFYPYGHYDLLDTWALGVQMAHLAPAADWLDTITTNPSQQMQLPWDGVLRPGCPADFLYLTAHDGLDIMTPAKRQRRVCRQGAWI